MSEVAVPSLGIVGTHVEGSLSPIMQNAAFQEMGFPHTYGRFQLAEIGDFSRRQQMFDEFLARQAELGVLGMSVTMPFKENILSSPQAALAEGAVEAIGAANTLSHHTDGRWAVENTDWLGATTSLKEAEVEVSDKQALVIGAGGTARAVAYGLAREGASQVIIANRTKDKAVWLADEFGLAFPDTEFVGVDLVQVNNPLAGQALTADAAIVYNTATVGQTNTDAEGQSPLSNRAVAFLPTGAVVNDAVYMPIETPLLSQVKRIKGEDQVTCIDGTRMLLHQAVAQVRIFTGEEDVPIQAMDTALQAEVQRRQAI